MNTFGSYWVTKKSDVYLNQDSKSKRRDNSVKMHDTVIYLGQWPIFMTPKVCVKFQVNTFDSFWVTKNSDVYLNQDSKSKRGDNSVKMHDTVIYLGQWPIFMTPKVCVKFQVNTFDSCWVTKNSDVYLNHYADADADDWVSTIALTILRIVELKMQWMFWDKIAFSN